MVLCIDIRHCLYGLHFSENADNVLHKCQASPLNIHNSDSAIGSLTGGGAGGIGMPGISSGGGLAGGGGNVSNTAGGPPQYDISFVFQDSSKLAKNAKRSYESQVCNLCVHPAFVVLSFFIQCFDDVGSATESIQPICILNF